VFDFLSKIQGENSTQRKHLRVGKQLLKYGGIEVAMFDNFQVTERTRNLVGRESAAWVQIPDPAPRKGHQKVSFLRGAAFCV